MDDLVLRLQTQCFSGQIAFMGEASLMRELLMIKEGTYTHH